MINTALAGHRKERMTLRACLFRIKNPSDFRIFMTFFQATVAKFQRNPTQTPSGGLSVASL